jgi:hypothetical protein
VRRAAARDGRHTASWPHVNTACPAPVTAAAAMATVPPACRSARQAAALAAIGQAVQAPTPPDLATALLPDIAGRQWLDQAKQAQQLLSQVNSSSVAWQLVLLPLQHAHHLTVRLCTHSVVALLPSQASAVLQQKVAQQAARAAAPPAPAAAAAAAAGDAEPHQGRGTKRPLELATPFAAATTNKGHAQHQAQQGQQQHRQQGTAAATCSNATSAAAAAAGRWREPAAHAAGDGSEEPDAGDSRPVSATRLVQQQHAGGAAGGVGSSRPGFQSARAQLVSDLRKKGQHQQASAFANQVPVVFCARSVRRTLTAARLCRTHCRDAQPPLTTHTHARAGRSASWPHAPARRRSCRRRRSRRRGRRRGRRRRVRGRPGWLCAAVCGQGN